MSDTAKLDDKRDWRATFATYSHPRVIQFLFLGFSAGLPFLLVFSTLSAWLREFGISRTAIGFISWIGITYSFKFVWSPVVDRVPLPLLTRWLGRRRAWMLLAQSGIAGGLLAMSFCDPRTDLWHLVMFALVVAFSSATQDIAMDAMRIEATDESLQGATAATYQLGYRIAVLAASAGALYIAQFGSWPIAYQTMAALGLVGLLTTLSIAEPERREASGTAEREGKVADFAAGLGPLPRWLRESLIFLYGAIVCPFVDFFIRYGWMALVLLAFIGLFRLADIAMGVMANPFYIDMGFTLAQIANVSKIFGFVMSIVGALTGGALVFRIGAARLLVPAVIAMSLANLTFAAIAWIGEPNTLLLAGVISIDNLVTGMAGSVFIAFLSSLTNAAYTATQYALFTSIMTLPGKIIAGYSGWIVDTLQASHTFGHKFGGYALFFCYTALLGLPALILALVVRRQFEKETPPPLPKEG
ncbi:MFS transporter, PAT family, beta-lactamase induction signal transducer AmpG [Enhydrobacter aerosaccus]|uniref:MFS transporter, PAT family, beta-lactamase induction signal transducer AmpG n=1 Tax=Enhydrobacter aerosaccus TaxID=225324 RepID=A0A1T4Q9C5_9HYPH|nr:MFS transporter [Enhydrobacter aerosaccus]SKA00339.1 MFS transporter, PAT family, beta-lactamase induction signal transducer AmpG [Enhydrobacter aerosaccus]